MEFASKRSNYFSTAVCSTTKLLKEALGILSTNVKLFSAIALLEFIPFALLFLLAELVLKPQASEFLVEYTEMISSEDQYPRLFKRALLILSEPLLAGALLWILSVFSMVINICASSIIYSGDQKDLGLGELLANIRTPWKRAAITWVYVTLFNMGLATVYVLVAMLITKGSMAATVMGYSLATLYYLLNLFLTVLWTLGGAISALEDGKWYGMKALSKAWDLMKGRRLQGFLLAALFALVTLPVTAIRGWKVEDDRESLPVRVVLGVLSVGISGLLQLFAYAAYTVFYYECKKSDGVIKGRYSLMIPLSPSS